MYQKWKKPTGLELNNVLSSIAKVNDLNVYNNSELVSFICTQTGLSKSCIYRFFCSDLTILNNEVKQIKLSQWLFLNILAKNDIDEVFNYARCELLEDTSAIINTLGDNAFKSIGNGFELPCVDSMNLMFLKTKHDYNKSICTMNKLDFTNSLCINYNVFCRSFNKNEISYIHFKLYLLTLGFSVADVGIFIA